MNSNEIENKHLCREMIKKSGWKQGACLFVTNECNLYKTGIIQKVGLYIVLTQDCDLLHPSLDTEPTVELIYAKKIEEEKYNGLYHAGKHPRVLHLQIDEEDNISYYELHIRDRTTVDRRLLFEYILKVDFSISSKVLDILISWVIKRYNRASFPDEFDKRRNSKKITKKIREVLNPYLQEIYGLFIKLDKHQELPSDVDYNIELILLIETNVDEEKIFTLQKCLDDIVEIIDNHSTKINVEDDYRVKKLSDIYASDYLRFKLWDFDYLSYKNN